MPNNVEIAIDGKDYFHTDMGQFWLASWWPPTQPPEGTCHGSAGVCFTKNGKVVLITEDGASWCLPGGRPEGDEDWRQTLEREVLEEACATVDSAVLVGYSRGQCLSGHEEGLILVRSLWSVTVTLKEWLPLHEVKARRIVTLAEARQIPLAHSSPQVIERLFAEASSQRRRSSNGASERPTAHV